VTEHEFDGISLVFGLLFAATGLIVLLDGDLLDQGRFLVPVGLFALGFALLGSGSGRSREDRPGDQVGAERGEDGEV
jgi:hypothetical protein